MGPAHSWFMTGAKDTFQSINAAAVQKARRMKGHETQDTRQAGVVTDPTATTAQTPATSKKMHERFSKGRRIHSRRRVKTVSGRTGSHKPGGSLCEGKLSDEIKEPNIHVLWLL